MTYSLHYYGTSLLVEYIEQDGLTFIPFHFYAFIIFEFLQIFCKKKWFTKEIRHKLLIFNVDPIGHDPGPHNYELLILYLNYLNLAPLSALICRLTHILFKLTN